MPDFEIKYDSLEVTRLKIRSMTADTVRKQNTITITAVDLTDLEKQFKNRTCTEFDPRILRIETVSFD